MTTFYCDYDGGCDYIGPAPDYSIYQRTATLVQTGALSATQYKFGDSSLSTTTHASGSGLTVPTSTSFDFGADPFTIEGGWYFTDASVTNACLVSRWSATGTAQSFHLSLVAGNLSFIFVNSGATTITTAAAWAPSQATWYHVAVDRSIAGDVRIYVDGTSIVTASHTDFIRTGTVATSVGYLLGYLGTYNINGYIDEVRITKGIARYAGNFTAPTAAHPHNLAEDKYFNNVVLLQHFDSISSPGASFAKRFRSISGATAAIIAPGDTIRIMASPTPTSLETAGSLSTWTNGPTPAAIAPTSSTNATPIVMTKVGHGLVTGDTIVVTGHTTNTKANGTWEVTVSGDTFTLLNADGTNSVGNGTGGATGTFRKITNCVVKLAAALTTPIALNGNRGIKTNWTGGTANSVPSIITTDYKQGGECLQIAINATFTTGIAAYFATGTLDLSAYRQFSFWIKQVSGTIGSPGSITVNLCTDTAGATPVHSYTVPCMYYTAYWHPFTFDNGATLNSAIESISFVINTDNAAQTFLLDNIIACKDSTAANSLSLTSLIGKNSGTEAWYGIQSIQGTRVVLDCDANSMPIDAATRGYMGASEAVTTYKRQGTSVLPASAVEQTILDSGTAGNVITYSGGWDRTDMSTSGGDTYFDGHGAYTYGLYSTQSYITVSHLSFCRWRTGFKGITSSNYLTLDNCNVSNCFAVGVYITAATNATVSIINANNNAVGVEITGEITGSTFSVAYANTNDTGVYEYLAPDGSLTIGQANGNLVGVDLHNTVAGVVAVTSASYNSTYGVYLRSHSNSNTVVITDCNYNGVGIYVVGSDSHSNQIIATNVNNNTTYGVQVSDTSCLNNTITTGACTGNGTSSMSIASFPTRLTNAVYTGVIATVADTYPGRNVWITSTNDQGDTDSHLGWTDGGTSASEKTIRHTASGIAWKLSPTTTARTAIYPLSMKIATVACAAGSTYTISAYFRRTHADLNVRIMCRAYQLTGVDATSQAMTAVADTWELRSIAVTPSVKGVLEVYAECWGGTTYSMYVDDITIA